MSNLGKAKQRAKVSQRGKKKSPVLSLSSRKTRKQKIAVSVKHTASKLAPKPGPSQGKKVSQKLLEIIKKRQQTAPKVNRVFGKPPGRRGRRPKQPIEYVPEHQEEENVTRENEYERLEYDTGIQVKSGGEDAGVNFERPEDFDEELNFDW